MAGGAAMGAGAVVSTKAQEPIHGLDGGADLLRLPAGDNKPQGLTKGMDATGKGFVAVYLLIGGQDRFHARCVNPLACASNSPDCATASRTSVTLG